MLADKSKTATVNGLNQLFKINSAPQKRTTVEVAADAKDIVNAIPVSDRVVRPFDVDDICERIIAGDYAEQQDPEFMLGGCFAKHVAIMANDYCNHIKTDCVICSKCFSCPFHKKADEGSDKHDGYCECWIEKAGFDPAASTRPLIKDMSGQYISKDKFVKEQKFYMEDLTEAKVWIDYGGDGKVKNPYKLLPPIASYLGIDVDLDDMELRETESVANGGAALAAYAKMQFSDGAMSEALEKALLTYCELDTLAMVFIWEYFFNECNK